MLYIEQVQPLSLSEFKTGSQEFMSEDTLKVYLHIGRRYC